MLDEERRISDALSDAVRAAAHGHLDDGIGGPRDTVTTHSRHALVRTAETDAERIQVTTQDSKVILTGTVRSWGSAARPSVSPGRQPVSPRWRT
ncbi:hypothetical protein Areg01_83410 [Actinoplanes regularis]|nr:hypothetical protein Areg01_83410 [Actinoplanes regularis]